MNIFGTNTIQPTTLATALISRNRMIDTDSVAAAIPEHKKKSPRRKSKKAITIGTQHTKHKGDWK